LLGIVEKLIFAWPWQNEFLVYDLALDLFLAAVEMHTFTFVVLNWSKDSYWPWPRVVAGEGCGNLSL